MTASDVIGRVLALRVLRDREQLSLGIVPRELSEA
jgi:hypothetical protein